MSWVLSLLGVLYSHFGGPPARSSYSRAIDPLELIVLACRIGFVLFILWSSRDGMPWFGLRRPRKSDIPLFIGAFLIAIAAYAATQSDYNGSSLALIGPEKLPLIILHFLLVGLREEMLFRGYLMSRLTELTASKLAGFIIPSILFVVVHGRYGISSLVELSISALVLGLIYKWKNCIWPGALAHSLYDILLMLRP